MHCGKEHEIKKSEISWFCIKVSLTNQGKLVSYLITWIAFNHTATVPSSNLESTEAEKIIKSFPNKWLWTAACTCLNDKCVLENQISQISGKQSVASNRFLYFLSHASDVWLAVHPSGLLSDWQTRHLALLKALDSWAFTESAAERLCCVWDGINPKTQ